MTQTPSWRNAARSSTTEHYREQSLEQQLLLWPDLLHYDLLDYFCCLNFSQRRQFLIDTLKKMGISHQILRTKNAFHIVVKPNYEHAHGTSLGLYHAKCFIAHYDRRIQTPGANDNNAAVWHLLNLAAQMQRECPVVKTPMQIIFTDHEELRSTEHIRDQGAYLLAQHLRNHNAKLRYVFFVFDQCGVGDTLCYLPNILTSKSILQKQEQILQQIQEKDLYKIPLHKITHNQYYFSDNLGFNLSNYPALLFSTLPQKDARLWQDTGEKPQAWGNIHTKDDTVELLEACSFTLMNQVLSRLSRI